MPQPLSKIPHAGGIIIFNYGMGPEATVARPKLATLAMTVIARFSTVDTFMLLAYVNLMGGPKDLAADMFMRMETRSANISALEALSDRLSPERQDMLKQITKAAKTAQKTRDKIAHWVWGLLPDRQDCVLLADPKLLLRNVPELPRDEVLVFFEKDFESALDDVHRVIELLSRFR